MRKDAGSTNPPQVVKRTGLAVVHEGERIFAAAAAQAEMRVSGANVVNYYFPVEIEVVGAEAGDALAESIYDALQRELSALG
jgi:hypothetical protein